MGVGWLRGRAFLVGEPRAWWGRAKRREFTNIVKMYVYQGIGDAERLNSASLASQSGQALVGRNASRLTDSTKRVDRFVIVEGKTKNVERLCLQSVQRACSFCHGFGEDKKGTSKGVPSSGI